MAKNWYELKLLDVRWQKKKNGILTRDNYTCQNNKCGSTTETMHVHHKHYTYGKDPWDYPDEVLTTLCAKCHKNEHKPLNIMQVIGELVKEKPIITSIRSRIDYLRDTLKGDLKDEEMNTTLLEIVTLQKKEIQLESHGRR